MAKSKTLKVTEIDRYLFGQGTNYEIYKLMGAHPTKQRGKTGFILLCGHLMQKVFL